MSHTEKPKYVVTREAGFFDGHQLVPAGVEIEHEGEPGDHLEPVNDAAKKRVKDAEGKVQSAPGANLMAGSPNGSEGSKGDSDEVKELKRQLAEAQGKLAHHEGKDAAHQSAPHVEPVAAPLAAPQDVGTSGQSHTFAVDLASEEDAQGFPVKDEPEAKRGPGRPRKSS